MGTIQELDYLQKSLGTKLPRQTWGEGEWREGGEGKEGRGEWGEASTPFQKGETTRFLILLLGTKRHQVIPELSEPGV